MRTELRMTEAPDFVTLAVGSKPHYFYIPLRSLPYFQNFDKLSISQQGLRISPLRDPKIFAFIHRWLCGYPAHLPAEDWQVICLLDDCNFYGVPILADILVAKLKDQNTNLGRKVRFLLANPSLADRCCFTSSWEDIMGLSVSIYQPLFMQTCKELAQQFERSKTEQFQLLAPFINLAAYNAPCCRDLLIWLVKDFGITLPQPDALMLLKDLFLTRFTAASPPTRAATTAESHADSEEEPPSQDGSEAASTSQSKSASRKRRVPPPSPNPEFLSFLKNIQGEDSSGVRVYGGTA
jgi:hypothetical protein